MCASLPRVSKMSAYPRIDDRIPMGFGALGGEGHGFDGSLPSRKLDSKVCGEIEFLRFSKVVPF